MLSLVLFTALVGCASALCPESYKLERNGDCYKEYNTGVYVYASNGLNSVKSYCSEAFPVSIHSQEDQSYWFSIAKENKKTGTNYGNLFLGIQCNQKTWSWEWADGSKIDYKPAVYDSTLSVSCSSNYIYSWWIDGKTGEWKALTNTYIFIDIYCVVTPDHSIAPSDPACSEFTHDQSSDICYKVEKKALNHNAANSSCADSKASLASIHSSQENAFYRRLAISNGLVSGLQLGGTVNGQTFHWDDNSNFNYDNFAPGFPIDGLGNCLAMDTNSVNGPWMNVECSTKLPFVCVRPPHLDAEVACDGALRKEGETIRSPGFPSSSDVPCDYFLKVDPGYLVEVEIISLEANSCCDSLVLSEGTLGGNVIATLTGDRATGKKYRTKSENFMRVSWQPNGGVNVKGMEITFRAVKK